ncbi:MAG: hypothetical protein GY791_13010 [Alphaproteobacteria bacterium]|nr:hypothetical protein [Alphaproteobacteria bacterium]
MNPLRGLCIVTFFVTVASAAAALSWQQELTLQLDEEQGCTLSFLSQVVERVIDGRETVIAKAHCEDKRAFDVYRDNPRKPFEIKPCGIVEEIAC